MMEKAVARMDRIYTDALAAGVLRTDRYLVLEKPVEKEDLPEETIAEVPAGEVDASVTPPVAQPGVVSFTVQYASPDVRSLSATASAIDGIPGVQSAATTSLPLRRTSALRVTFRVDIAPLNAAPQARGHKVPTGRQTLPHASCKHTP